MLRDTGSTSTFALTLSVRFDGPTGKTRDRLEAQANPIVVWPTARHRVFSWPMMW
jgi:hypothetical protein